MRGYGLPALAALLLASGCTAGWLSSAGREPSEAEQMVARADALVAKGWDHAARALYERVAREYPGDPAGGPGALSISGASRSIRPADSGTIAPRTRPSPGC